MNDAERDSLLNVADDAAPSPEDAPEEESRRGPFFHPNATPLGKLAVLTFRRDLPQLMKERPGEWVAYHGDQRVAIAKTDLEVYRECERRGIPEDDMIIHPIEPLEPDVVYLDY